MDISKATQRNWARLNSDPTHRLSARANKTQSRVRFIPKERCSSPQTVAFIESLLPFESDYSLRDILYSLCRSILIQRNVRLDLIEAFAADYSHRSPVKELTELELPEEFDLLGTVYQSFLTEGAKNKAGSYYTVKTTAETLLSSMNLKPGERFIDPCCGSGTFLIAAHRLGCIVKGFDVDEIAVMIAKANLLSAGLTNYPDIDCLDFKSFKPEGCLCYDASASNPPWGRGQSKGYSDIACEFFLKTYALLREGGKINFLLPNALLNVASHRAFRESLLSDGILEEIRLFGSDFSGVQTACFSALFIKGAPKKTIRFVDKKARIYEVPTEVYGLTPQRNIFPASAEELSALKKILSKGTYSLEKCQWGLGIVTGNNKEFLKDEPAPDLEPIFTGKDIRPFSPEKPKNFIRFDRSKFQQAAKDEIYRTCPKLIYKFISSRPTFALDENGTLVLNSANVLIPKELPFSLEALLALLNSDAFAFTHRVLFGEVKFLQGNLVPILLPALSSGDDKRLSRFVVQVLKEPQVLETINNFIFDLYDLTEAERSAIRLRLSNRQ